MDLKALLTCVIWLVSLVAANAAEQRLNDQQIMQLLPTIVSVGDDTRQTFSGAGATTYTVGGRDTYGVWRADGDRYCSQWPPVRDWDCYEVHRDAQNRLIWIAPNGHRTVTLIVKKN